MTTNVEAVVNTHNGNGAIATTIGETQTDVVALLERLAALEQRVRELEGGTGRARRGAKAKPQRS